jgi:hypothetical protein
VEVFMTIYHAKDNAFKLIFGNNDFFVQFLRDFIPIDLLKTVQPDDIEDIKERYIPLFQDSRESDTVKRVNLKGRSPLFVIAILEHESKVNFRTCFKMLQYICLVLDAYEKELPKGATLRKDFKYPPVLPVVFYDGRNTWTAERNLLNRTALSEVFGKYIPKFEYELVDLHCYDPVDLARFGDALSIVLMIDRLPAGEGASLLERLPDGYLERIDALHIPDNMRKVLKDTVRVLLERAKARPEEIVEISSHIERKEYSHMFEGVIKAFKDNRQEGRQEGWQEGRQEGWQEGRQEGWQEGRQEGWQEGRQEGWQEAWREMAQKLKARGRPLTEIAEDTGLPPDVIAAL